jgi:anion-transporting  ArsA/GET3 family ATPase
VSAPALANLSGDLRRADPAPGQARGSELDRKEFKPPARVTIVAGKGGVGKTTVSATLAYVAALAGLRTLIVEVEGKSGLPELFGRTDALTYQEAVLLEAGEAGPGSAELRARTLTPDDALVEYLETHGLRRVSRRLSSTGTLDVVATAIPGIKDILVLGKVKQLEVLSASGAEGAPEFIVVDAPAAGHAVSFLASAYGLLDAAPVGPIRVQAVEVTALLGDPDRCQVMLVTIPEETPVNEAADTAFHLEDRAGVKLAPIVVNAVWPRLDLALDGVAGNVRDAAEFRLQRQALQEEQMARLASLLPLPQLTLPFLFTTELGRGELEVLAESFAPQLAAARA